MAAAGAGAWGRGGADGWAVGQRLHQVRYYHTVEYGMIMVTYD